MGDYIRNPSDLLQVSEPWSSYGLELIRASRRGVHRSDFVHFIKLIKQSVQTLSQVIPASYSSLSKKDIYDQETSERIYEIAQIYAIGKEVFGDIDRFNDWLTTNSIAMGGVTPFSLLDTSFGVDLIRKEISRIDYGVFS